MIRLVLVAVFLILFLVLSIPIMLVELIIEKSNMNLRNRSGFAIVKWGCKVILFLSGVKVKVNGYENIPKDTPVLYVGNHNSYFDVVIGYALVPGLTGFIAKKEIKKIPLLRHWMYFLNCLFLDRDNVRAGIKTILAAIEEIKSGISIFIFPEGTRSKDGNMLPFKEGSMKIAEKSGCPIIPVGFKNTADIFENHIPFIKKTEITVTFGEALYPKNLSKEDKKFLGAYVQEKVKNLI